MRQFLHTLLLPLALSSYIPPYYEGIPTALTVRSLDPPDYRGQQSYRIEFSLDARAGLPESGFIHRTWEDFQDFRDMLEIYLPDFELNFPCEPSIESLDTFMKSLEVNSIIIGSNALHDFLGIN